MGKVIRRCGSFLMMLLLVIGILPMTVNAETTQNTEERNALYVQVPEDWADPCVWAWDSDGNNAFTAWPGEEMETDAANDGWYYIWLPAWANHVIVNANEGSVQTEEQILDTNAAWITVSAADTVEISYESRTTGEAPAYVEKFVVHAKVDDSWEAPCLWAWSAPDGTNAFAAWPGEEMKAGEDGWYSIKVPVWVNSIIVNANEGSVQTEDISIDPAELWVTVAADGSYDFSYKNPDQAETPNVTIHVSAPADWNGPCLWAWSAPDGTNAFAAWPGEALEEGEGGWLVKEIPGWVNSIIVNGNEGSVQTTDISVETGKDIWLTINGPEDYTVSYEEIALEETNETVATQEPAEAVEATIEATENTEKSTPVVPIVIGVLVVAAGGAAVAVSKKKSQK
uniref:starch-binding protein n=1 Tax=Waltera intestinalis TaxID=2606635 RepID=UPI003FEEDA42